MGCWWVAILPTAEGWSSMIFNVLPNLSFYDYMILMSYLQQKSRLPVNGVFRKCIYIAVMCYYSFLVLAWQEQALDIDGP